MRNAASHAEHTAGAAKLVRWVFLAVGLIFMSVGAWLVYGAYVFQQTAIIATAEVLSVERIETRERDRDGDMKTTVTYRPTLAYDDHYGAARVGTPSLQSSTYNFAVGTEVEVAFNPDNPSEVRINDFISNWGFGGAFFAFGSVFVIIGWFVTRRIERKVAGGAVQRLRETGAGAGFWWANTGRGMLTSRAHSRR